MASVLASVLAAAFMFLLVLALCCRSICLFRRNSEKSNHMLSAKSKMELEFYNFFQNKPKVQIPISTESTVPEGAVTSLSGFYA